MKYMKRVSAELETGGGGGPEEEELIVQGVRYAFRVHQVKTHLLVFLPLNKLYILGCSALMPPLSCASLLEVSMWKQ
jgi:hypothetical protein